MADRILKAVARTNYVAERVVVGDTLHDLIRRFATQSIYGDPAQMDKLTARILNKARTQMIPLANQAGVRNADDLMVGIQKRVGEGEARLLKARAASKLRGGTNKNMLNLKDGLKAAQGNFREETRLELRRARFGVENRKQIERRLAKADRADLGSWEKFQGEHRQAVRDENAALKKLSTEPENKKAAADVKAAQAEQKKAFQRMRRRRSFLARFENATAREMKDAVRMQTRIAQDARFRELGFTDNAQMQWITVNGADTCPDCTPMHGVTKASSEWAGQEPGSGWTVCEQSCMCSLVPVEYSVGNRSVSEPLLGPRTPRDRSLQQSAVGNTPLPV